MGNSLEDVDALELTANGDIYLTTSDVFAVTGISGEDEDIFVCTPAYTGSAVTSCTYSSTLYFDGSAFGLSANDVDAINLPLGIASSPRPYMAYTLPRPGGGQGGGHFASYKLEPPQQTGSITFTPVADAYVDNANSTTNYGTSTTLRADATPVINSYLRFGVQGLTGTITSATLRIYANSSSSTGYTLKSVSDNTWTETGITFSTAPAMGNSLGASGAITTGTWTTVDVTSYITVDGTYSFAFSTTSSTNISFSSREGANAPELVIETSTGPTNTPTATVTAGPSPTPTNTSVATPTASTTPTPTATSTGTVAPPASPTPQPFQSASFSYDGDGKRVKSVINGTTTTFFIGNYYERVGINTITTITKYYYAGGQRIAMRTNGTLQFLLGDHLGSTSLVTDAAGEHPIETHYKAWGEVRYTSGPTPTDYTFNGQYSHVDDFGLMFYNARWYDSSLGRFAQADSIIPGGVQGLDRYAYVFNNPIAYIDPTGHCGVKQGKFDGKLDCTADDINSATMRQRLLWFKGLIKATGREEWFANIVGILEAFIDEELGESNSWVSWTDAGILVSIQNGFGLFESKGSNNSDADMAWKDFFLASNNTDRKQKWGEAENLGTQYGLRLAEEHGATMNEREQFFLKVGNTLYRDLLQSGEMEQFYGQLAADIGAQYCDPNYRDFCGGWVDGLQSAGASFGAWFGDPRSTERIFGKAPVYYIARLILDR